MLIAPGEIAAAFMAGALEHHVHEGAAPQAAAPGRIGADVFARLGHQRVAGDAAEGGIGMRLRTRASPRQPAACKARFGGIHACLGVAMVAPGGGRGWRIHHVHIARIAVIRRLHRHLRSVAMRFMDALGGGRAGQQGQRHRTQQYRRPFLAQFHQFYPLIVKTMHTMQTESASNAWA